MTQFSYLRFIVFLFLVISPKSAFTQELVRNGSFEMHNACDGAEHFVYDLTYSNFPTATDWIAPTHCTPDYYSRCATPSFYGIPQTNKLYYQMPRSGDAYAAIFALWSTPPDGADVREYLSSKLIKPMTRDALYHVRFFVSLVGTPNGSETLGLMDLGINFSDTLPHHWFTMVGVPLNLPYHINNDPTRPLLDTAGWEEVSGTYIAKGGEEWLTLGSFGPQLPRYTVKYGPNKYGSFAYYYIDDVSVTPVEPKDSVVYLTLCDSSTTLTSAFLTGRYRWSTGDSAVSIVVNQPGNYYCVAASDSGGFITRFVVSPGWPEAHDTTICQYVTDPGLYLKDTGLLWYTQATGGSGSSQQPKINTGQPGKMTLYVARQHGDCAGKRVPVNITIMTAPGSGVTKKVDHCDDSLAAGVTLGSGSHSDLSYLWNTGDTVCCIRPDHDGYFVRTSSNGCGSGVDTFLLTKVTCERCIAFPDAFTPNSDGRNEVFRALVRCPVRDFHLAIYNRWGERVFSTSSESGFWTGSQNGKPAPEGTYMYYSTYVNATTGIKTMAKGALSLIR